MVNMTNRGRILKPVQNELLHSSYGRFDLPQKSKGTNDTSHPTLVKSTERIEKYNNIVS